MVVPAVSASPASGEVVAEFPETMKRIDSRTAVLILAGFNCSSQSSCQLLSPTPKARPRAPSTRSCNAAPSNSSLGLGGQLGEPGKAAAEPTAVRRPCPQLPPASNFWPGPVTSDFRTRS